LQTHSIILLQFFHYGRTKLRMGKIAEPVPRQTQALVGEGTNKGEKRRGKGF
jgi:hypothetical protein